ncbi:MAG: type I-C CRISPR-associated endonuclease Cas1c [Clostridiales bacterium]|nr:type I-C CRISPR-associated endonuclease Cas1c [Clostridiales bacterium]
MRKLLNTLFITSENAYLSLEGETVCVEIQKQKVGQFPLHTLENILCFSYNGATPAFMGACAKRGINLAFYSPQGRFLCRAVGESRGNVLLRKTQYRLSDQEKESCLITRNFILGKVFNCRWSIDRTVRDHGLRIDTDRCMKVTQFLSDGMSKIKTEEDLDSLRGIEGECASLYFGIFDDLILNQKEAFYFHGRNKRPPLDNVNAMLSFGYSLLANDCAGALEGVGLDSYVGFMHWDRPGRKSLALDLMEELRPVLVDRFVLTLINNRQIHREHFRTSESGAVMFTDEGKKKYLSAWQEHKREQITHPFLKEKVYWGLVPHIQALLLARYLRNDMDGYPPFMWK